MIVQKPAVMMRMVPSDAALREELQLRVLFRRVNDQRRIQLFEHIAVVLEQQSKELPRS